MNTNRFNCTLDATIAACRSLLELERAEKDNAIAIWRGQAQRAEAERDAAYRALDWYRRQAGTHMVPREHLPACDASAFFLMREAKND